MNLLLVAATPFEIGPTLRYLAQHFTLNHPNTYQKGNLLITPLVTGVGSTVTAWHLAHAITTRSVDWALNAGVAGAFDRTLALGEVVQVVSEQFGDLGVEEADGRFTDLFQMGLCDPNDSPYVNGVLYNAAAGQTAYLPAVRGLTVNQVHGSLASIESVRKHFPGAQVESMEGAAFFFGCLSANIPFAEIRAISNYVEARNRENWQLELAIENLNRVLCEMIESLSA